MIIEGVNETHFGRSLYNVMRKYGDKLCETKCEFNTAFNEHRGVDVFQPSASCVLSACSFLSLFLFYFFWQRVEHTGFFLLLFSCKSIRSCTHADSHKSFGATLPLKWQKKALSRNFSTTTKMDGLTEASQYTGENTSLDFPEIAGFTRSEVQSTRNVWKFSENIKIEFLQRDWVQKYS